MRRQHPLTLCLLACALFLRLWVPAGWMPVAAHGTLLIAPCPAAQPVLMVHSGEHSNGKHQQHGGNFGDCGFAPFQAGVDLAHAAPAPLPAAVVADGLPQQRPLAYLATGPPSPPPPATGPPMLT
jgi:hypothetical protein